MRHGGGELANHRDTAEVGDLTPRLFRLELGETPVGDVDVRDDRAAIFVLEPIDSQLVPARLRRRPAVVVPAVPRTAIEHHRDATADFSRFAAPAVLGAGAL